MATAKEMTTDREALLPCPFCGSDEAELQNTHTPSFWIECLSCGATARGKYFPTKAKESQHYAAEPRGFNERNFKGLTGAYKKAAESAITAWNHRAALTAQGGEQTAESAAIKPCPACSAPMRVCSHCEGDGYEPGTDNDVTGPSLCHECNGIGGKYLQQTDTVSVPREPTEAMRISFFLERSHALNECPHDYPGAFLRGYNAMLAATKEGK